MSEVVKIYAYDITNLPVDFRDVPLVLEEDINYALHYKKNLDQKQHIVSRYFKRKYVPDCFLSTTEKPLSKEKFFNISHSGDIVLMAICDTCEIGVDIEYKSEAEGTTVKNYICSKEELDYIKNDSDFYKVWTSKESLLKCCGSGLVNELKKVNSLPIDGVKEYNGKKYYSHYIDYNDAYSISVTIFSEYDFKIELIEEYLYNN